MLLMFVVDVVCFGMVWEAICVRPYEHPQYALVVFFFGWMVGCLRASHKSGHPPTTTQQTNNRPPTKHSLIIPMPTDPRSTVRPAKRPDGRPCAVDQLAHIVENGARNDRNGNRVGRRRRRRVVVALLVAWFVGGGWCARVDVVVCDADAVRCSYVRVGTIG